MSYVMDALENVYCVKNAGFMHIPTFLSFLCDGNLAVQDGKQNVVLGE